ncbi:putative glutamine synthetase [Helianthus debilis subsp. tardiflorus]
MCDAYTLAGKPIPTNKRRAAGKIFSNPEVEKEVPWYRIEQEYTMDVNWPLGWPQGGFPGPQGPYYCGIGTDKAFGHDIVDAHNKACLYAGINISGINGEVMSVGVSSWTCYGHICRRMNCGWHVTFLRFYFQKMKLCSCLHE